MSRRIPMLSRILCLLTLGAVSAWAAGGPLPEHIAAAIDSSARPSEDKGRDAERKPGETLMFAGVKPGMKVLELAPGKGYFTRLLSLVVGPKGHVYALTGEPKPGAPPPAVQAVAAEPGFSNLSVIVMKKHADPLDLPEKVDLVWTTQNYHDFHNLSDVDMATFNKHVFEALKPGGTYFVLDHAAQAGSGARDTNTLHRIDEDLVKKEVEAAGFKFVGESDILRNKADTRTAKVFDPEIRGHTDQFIFKFRKP